MTSEIERPDPPYMQVVNQIRRQIESGTLKPGDTIPSARQITRQWGVSLATATKVLAALRSEGLARGIVGVGTVVVSPAATAQDRLASIKQTGRIYEPGSYAKITSAEVVPAPEHVAEALGVIAGSPVIRRHRVTYRNDAPVSSSTSWFDGPLAESSPLLLRAERLPQGTPGYIQETTGRTAVAGRDHVAARLATAQDAAELGIEPGTAVLQGENWYLDEDGAVLEFGEYVTAGDRGWSYDYRVPR